MIDLNLTAKQWTREYDGILVSFYKLNMPSCKTFNGKWIAWFECDLFDYEPTYFDSEPTQEQVEALYTG